MKPLPRFFCRPALPSFALRASVDLCAEALAKADVSAEALAKVDHHNRLLAKALPDPVFKYFSKAAARVGEEKEIQVTSSHGLNCEVWGEPPALCFFRRFWRSPVTPTYFLFGHGILRMR
jgi:hypothetical protein